MIKEIRIGMDEFIACSPEDFNLMLILKDKGFPVDGSLKPKDGLKYYDFHDYQSDEIVVQWEELLDKASPSSVEK